MPKRNKELASFFRSMRCMLCNKQAEGDHIFNWSSDPRKDKLYNMWPLCREHHTEKGFLGRDSFIKKYNLEAEMTRRGFKKHKNGNWYIPHELLNSEE